ncbi:MAG TPA: hypothetical protein VFZ36_07880 [Vicinamibacterales bacterium]
MLRGTIWLAVAAWAVSEVLRAGGPPGRAARAAFTAGALLLAVHTAAAFQLHHGWSHAEAFSHTALRTEQMTGVASGSGLYLNYAFIALWLADAAWWWLRPDAYLHRARLADALVFAFFVFMMVNGAVVFAAGPMRLFGAAAVAAALAARLTARAPRNQLQGERA